MMNRIATALAAVLLGLGLSIASVPAASATGTSNVQGDGSTTTPIKHFIFLMQGDRSFDNYFGTYPGADGIPANVCQQLDSKLPSAGCVKPYALHGTVPNMLAAGDNELDKQYDKGSMDGFVSAFSHEGRDGSTVMGYYDRRDLPTYWDLASRYVLFDHFFASTLAGARSNRSYWVAGAAPPSFTAPWLNSGWSNKPTIFDELQQAGVSWKFYVQDYDPNQTFRTASRTNPTTQPVRVPLLDYPRFVDDPALNSHIVDLSQYYTDLQNGTLPAVTYIASSGSSERSARSIPSGQNLVSNLVDNLMLSKYWKSSAFLMSYDGSGGWYDHVKPPQVDANGYGLRVPALLISAYARPGQVNHTVLDYTSALAFIEKNWHIKPLESRDAKATSIVSAFNFAAAPRIASVRFGKSTTATSPHVTSSVVYWCYGAALGAALCILIFALAAPRFRRRRVQKTGEPVPQTETVGAKQ